MGVARCMNCKNMTIKYVHRVNKGEPCEETPYCKESAKEHRAHQRAEMQAFQEQRRKAKEAKNRRNKANRAARAKENELIAAGANLRATRKMGETK